MSYFSVKDFTTNVAAKIRSVLVNTDENIPVHILQDSAGNEIFGTKTDAKATQTDTTSVSAMSVFKQLSASLQTIAAAIKGEDTASADADPGFVINARRTAAPADQSGTDGDYEPPQIKDGYLWVAPPKPVKVNATFNRASNTTTYTVNDLVNASAIGATGALISWAISRGAGILRRVDVRHNATGSTGFNSATFRIWLFDSAPTPTASQGDNDVFSQALATAIGFIDVAVSSVGTDVVKGWSNTDIQFVGGTLYGLVQILSGWTTPTASATFNIDLEYLPG